MIKMIALRLKSIKNNDILMVITIMKIITVRIIGNYNIYNNKNINSKICTISEME